MPWKKDNKGWHPCKLALLEIAGLLCSVLSSLDCEFLSVDVGFNPANSIFIESDEPIGLGLWTFQSPIKPQECLLYSVAANNSVTFEDESYLYPFLNGHPSWIGARISGVLSIIFGFFAAVITWYYVMSSSPSPRFLIIFATTFTALGLETCKILLFFNIHLCQSPVWEFQDNNQSLIKTFQNPVTCKNDRGSYAAIVCCIIYSLCILLITTAIYFGYSKDEIQQILQMNKMNILMNSNSSLSLFSTESNNKSIRSEDLELPKFLYKSWCS